MPPAITPAVNSVESCIARPSGEGPSGDLERDEGSGEAEGRFRSICVLRRSSLSERLPSDTVLRSSPPWSFASLPPTAKPYIGDGTKFRVGQSSPGFSPSGRVLQRPKHSSRAERESSNENEEDEFSGHLATLFS